MESNRKIIINVGRQIGSGGRIIARMLADDFKCGFYDRELLTLAAKESGFCEKFFEQNDEQKGFFHSLFHLHSPLSAMAASTIMSSRRKDCSSSKAIQYAAWLKQALVCL